MPSLLYDLALAYKSRGIVLVYEGVIPLAALLGNWSKERTVSLIALCTLYDTATNWRIDNVIHHIVTVGGIAACPTSWYKLIMTECMVCGVLIPWPIRGLLSRENNNIIRRFNKFVRPLVLVYFWRQCLLKSREDSGVSVAFINVFHSIMLLLQFWYTKNWWGFKKKKSKS
eukprot:jgi/Bigna1/77186/fgenesh1_pg.46_\